MTLSKIVLYAVWLVLASRVAQSSPVEVDVALGSHQNLTGAEKNEKISVTPEQMQKSAGSTAQKPKTKKLLVAYHDLDKWLPTFLMLRSHRSALEAPWTQPARDFVNLPDSTIVELCDRFKCNAEEFLNAKQACMRTLIEPGGLQRIAIPEFSSEQFRMLQRHLVLAHVFRKYAEHYPNSTALSKDKIISNSPANSTYPWDDAPYLFPHHIRGRAASTQADAVPHVAEKPEEGMTELSYLSLLHGEVLEVARDMDINLVRKILQDHDLVLSVDEDQVTSADQATSVETYPGDTVASSKYLTPRQLSLRHEPNDEFYKSQWYLREKMFMRGSIGFAEVYDLFYPDFGLDVEREPVIVAVVDSGVHMNHPDFQGAIYVNRDEICDDGIDNDNNGYVDDCYGWNFVDNNNDIQDLSGHGTAVASIIAARKNNSMYIAGICTNCRLLIIRVMNANSHALYTDIAKVSNQYSSCIALEYALKMKARISNHSYGGQSAMPETYANLVKRAHAQGHIVVGSAGNIHRNIDYTDAWTTSNTASITVGGIDVNAGMYRDTGYGQKVLLFAPAVRIAVLGLNENLIYYLNGCSLAVPTVVGAIAHLLFIFPFLEFDEIYKLLSDSSRKDYYFKEFCKTGGIFDFERAYRMLDAKYGYHW